MKENKVQMINSKYFSYLETLVKDLMKLETLLHNQDNPEILAKNALNSVAKFYEADWCGVVEADLVFNVWNPIWYIGGKTTDDVVQKSFEREETSPTARMDRRIT